MRSGFPRARTYSFRCTTVTELARDVKDRTSIGLVFAKEPVKHEMAQYEIWNNLFLIPPMTTTTA